MSNNVSSILKEAQILEDAQNMSASMDLIKKAYELEPKNPDVLEKLALRAQLDEDFNNAIFYWEELLKTTPDNIVAYSQLQDLYHEKDKFKYYLNRAKRKVMENNVNQAVSDFKKAIDNTDETKKIVEARFNLAKTFQFLNKTQNAIDEYYKIIALTENKEVYYNLIELLTLEDEYSAIKICLQAIANFNDAQFKEILAGLYLKIDDPQNAIIYAILPLTKAKIYLQLEQNEKAFEILSNIENKTDPKYLALTAEYYFNKKEFDNCFEYIEKLINQNPLNPLPYQMKALVYEEKRMEFEEHLNWGKYYQLKPDLTFACNEFTSAYKLNPKSVETVKELIKTYENLNDKIMLIEYCEILHKLEPQNFNVIKQLAQYYEKEGDKKRARNYYEKYVELAPVSSDLETIKNKLEKPEEIQEQYEGFLDKLIGFFSKEK